jgi:peptide/nickel transport system substrate-binding protein
MSVVRLLALSACIALSACSKAPVASAHSSNEPVTLTIGWPFISGLDSLNGIQQATRLLSFEGLVMIGRDGRPQPRLAQSWTESPDGLSWVFQLLPNAVFHDGSPVDSAAVKASLSRTLASPARDFSPGLLDIVALDTPRPDQVTIRLQNRSAFLLDDLVVSITKSGPDGRMIGTGPYVTSSTSPAEVVMKAFPSYYRAVPNIERIEWKSYPTARTSWAAMMRGEIDFLYEVSPDARDFMQNEASVEDFSFLRNYVHGVVFNSRRPFFEDSRVRRALNYAVDRSAIIDQVFKGHGLAASTPTWPQHWAYDRNLPNYAFDPARAAALLDAAGVTISDKRQDLHRSPARMRFTCIFPTSLLWERMALIAQRNLSQIAVDMQLESLSLDEFNRRIATGNFDAVLMDLVVGNATSRPYFFWYSTSKQNPWGYHDELVDQALDRLRYAADDDATRSAFHDLQSEMLNDPPAILLAFGETTRAVGRRFQPVTPPGGDVFRTISEWRVAGNMTAPGTN